MGDRQNNNFGVFQRVDNGIGESTYKASRNFRRYFIREIGGLSDETTEPANLEGEFFTETCMLGAIK